MTNKIKFVGRYIKYLLNAKHFKGHGIHSPFIFEFITKVLFVKDSRKNYSFIESYRNELNLNHQVVDLEGFGAGSKVLSQAKRKISDIALFSSTKRKYGQVLARMIRFYKPKQILELGTSLGIGSCYLAKFMKNNASLITIEGDKEIFNISKEKLCGLSKNIQVINSNFEFILPKLIDKFSYFDFVFFDGNHTKEATIRYFEQCLKNVSNQSVFVFDDIHWSTEMEEAWDYIQSHEKTMVCIDLFQIGIVFFRDELSMQNYKVLF